MQKSKLNILFGKEHIVVVRKSCLFHLIFPRILNTKFKETIVINYHARVLHVKYRRHEVC